MTFSAEKCLNGSNLKFLNDSTTDWIRKNKMPKDAHYKKNKTKITQHGVTNCFKNLISLGHTEERQ